VAFSRDSKLLASVSGDKTVWVWDAATGEQRQKLETTTSVMHLEHLEYSTDRTKLRTDSVNFDLILIMLHMM